MTGFRVQRLIMPSGAESMTVLADGLVVDPVDRFLAHLTAIDRSPNTVRGYAHDLRDYFEFLEGRGRDQLVVAISLARRSVKTSAGVR